MANSERYRPAASKSVRGLDELPIVLDSGTHRCVISDAASDVVLEELRRVLASIGPDALASHRTAASLWGFGPIGDIIDVLVPRRRRPRPRIGVQIHSSLHFDPAETSIRDGIRCTNPLRTLLDLGAIAPERVSAALAATAVSRLVIPSSARAALDRASVRGRPGLGALRAALDDWPLGDDAPDSELEVVVARLLRDRRLRRFEFHPRIAGFEVDFAHRGKRVVVETDGWEFHSSRLAFEEDRRRDAVLAAEGWLVVRVTWWQAVERPDDVAERLRSALARRFRLASQPQVA